MILYKLTNSADGKSYIGITSRPLHKRLQQHALTKTRGSALHAAIKQHGMAAFRSEALAISADWSSLLLLERAAIAQHGTLSPRGYNVTRGGQGMLGWNPSPETRAKISAINTGRKQNPEQGRKISAALTGLKRSEATRLKCSLARRGVKLSAAHCESLSRSHKGKGPPAEHMERLRQLHIGKRCPPETRDKIRQAHIRRGTRPSAGAIAAARRTNARVTEDQVINIRAERAAGQTFKAISARHGLSLSTVYFIAKRKAWAHVGPP